MILEDKHHNHQEWDKWWIWVVRNNRFNRSIWNRMQESDHTNRNQLLNKNTLHTQVLPKVRCQENKNSVWNIRRRQCLCMIHIIYQVTLQLLYLPAKAHFQWLLVIIVSLEQDKSLKKECKDLIRLNLPKAMALNLQKVTTESWNPNPEHIKPKQ